MTDRSVRFKLGDYYWASDRESVGSTGSPGSSSRSASGGEPPILLTAADVEIH